MVVLWAFIAWVVVRALVDRRRRRWEARTLDGVKINRFDPKDTMPRFEDFALVRASQREQKLRTTLRDAERFCQHVIDTYECGEAVKMQGKIEAALVWEPGK